MIPNYVAVEGSELSHSFDAQQIVRSDRGMADVLLGGGRVSGRGRGGRHSGSYFPKSHLFLLGPLLQTTHEPEFLNYRRL